MVLFYCTFVGLKRQDQRNVPDEHLLDIFELGGPEGSLEREEFGGKVRDGDMQHALRLYYDRTSGVVRLEASPLRGPKQDVPIWTAFITKYAVDPDHVAREGSRGVSFAALRPPPYVFLDDYRPPRNRHGEYCLEFTSREGWYPLVTTLWPNADSSSRCRLLHGDLGWSC